jgi:hypothetical protein
MNRNSHWLVATTVLAVPILGLLAARARATRQLWQDARRLLLAASYDCASVFKESQLAGLPAPVQRYFRHVLTAGQFSQRSLRLRHTGWFKTDLDKDWLAIDGEQYISAEPPAFIWQGTTRWFTARDEYGAGHGRLTVRLLGAVPVVRGHGPHYDQGELLRWLAECAWLPTRLLPGPDVAWTAIDDHAARLTCTPDGQAVTLLVRFNEHDEIAECEALRYFGDTTQLPWVGRFAQYQRRQGMLVPLVAEVSWVVDGQRIPYARFTVQTLEYDPVGPFFWQRVSGQPAGFSPPHRLVPFHPAHANQRGQRAPAQRRQRHRRKAEQPLCRRYQQREQQQGQRQAQHQPQDAVRHAQGL